ncbi:Ca2+-dependent phosphoinositide-specific phospholipase C [Aquisphaera insulae]|uniref:Ca2+-dependent phosphoinositide-specific phospholipase C n=1 Tax=Aquisphaera insulae TaxID=2712864 RepID=UPI0013EC3731|nr:Ca2+-dependent phosphoinositide-specific phospholipase C [Aquisphaera insulae]
MTFPRSSIRLAVALAASAAPLLLCGASLAAGDEPPLRLNQVQVVGTHNSYHIAPVGGILGLIAASDRAMAESLDYTHRPLDEQFSRLGIRQIEIDVFADPEGGRYAEPAARTVLRSAGKDPGPDPNASGRLRKPGLKVFHVQDIDFRSTATTLDEALGQVRGWSAAHPRHVPIFVMIEAKHEAFPALPTRPAPFGKAELDAIDAAIRAAFPPATILTPDDVRGESPTLPAAIAARGWPTLESCRGKVYFGLINGGPIRDLYLEGHPALRGRAMFAEVAPGEPAAAFFQVEDPAVDFEKVRELVRAGGIVRTRADAETVESRRDDPTRRDRALASGAQFVSTDYPEPRAEFSSYACRLPGGAVARPNPALVPSARVLDLEPLGPGGKRP